MARESLPRTDLVAVAGARRARLEWAIVPIGSNGMHDEWLYLGETELTAESIEAGCGEHR
jgi:hypothetical protein